MYHSKKKPAFPVAGSLREYLQTYDREEALPISYEELTEWSESFPVYDDDGKDTLWESVLYPQGRKREIDAGLTAVYALLKTDGDVSVIEHVGVEKIDYCKFGNSNPFRIKIVNQINDCYDYFYIKKADASRVYGLELEHILSPNRIGYILQGVTLIEEHIPGIPGDVFLDKHISSPGFYQVRMAKEFVKFNERCFVMLLGDMRSYNYVIDITPDFDREQYRTRPIDFDQFCYEGRKNHYLPQHYDENKRIVEFVTETLTPETVSQYRHEERSLIKKRYFLAQPRLSRLLDCMAADKISTEEKVASLRTDLQDYHGHKEFATCETMGAVLKLHMSLMLEKPKPSKLPGRTYWKTK